VRLLAAALVAVVALGAATPAWSATEGALNGGTANNTLPPPDPVSPRIFRPASQDVPPPTFAISARQAIAIADRTPQVRKARAQHPGLRATAYISPLGLRQGRFYHWDIVYGTGDTNWVEVELGRTGQVFEVQTYPDVGWGLLRGYPGVLGQTLNAPYVWLPLCLLFLLPFVDPRRPFRLLHLDLAMLLLFGISHVFFAAGRPDISVPLVYPFLLYAAARLAWAGFRPKRRDGALMPFVTTRFLIVGVVALLALRIVAGLADSKTFDISTAGVIGADRILHGEVLYVDNDAHGDTYGPVNYLMYVPEDLLWPFPNGTDTAAKVATLSFDVLTVLGLFLLGRRLRRGDEGTRLGAGLAYAWAACPYTALVIESNTNDALVPLFLIYGLIFISSPPARGALTAIASMAKFAPLLVAPVMIVGRGPFRWRTVLVSGGVLAVATVLILWPFVPPKGLEEVWDCTLGFQLGRTSPLSLWTRAPGLDWLRLPLEALVVALAIAATFFPRRRTTGQVAALCGAILAASQIPSNYWLYFYIVWFAPFLFIALFEEYPLLGPVEAGQLSLTRSLRKPLRISRPDSVTATRSSILTPKAPGT
jgi:hypothetical protein